MAQLRLVETHLNFIFSGLLCRDVRAESWLLSRTLQQTTARLRARRAAPALARHDTDRSARSHERTEAGGVSGSRLKLSSGTGASVR